MKHRKGGCLFVILKCFLILIFIVFIVVLGCAVIYKYNINKQYKELNKEIFTSGLDVTKSLSRQESDLVGYSKLEKYELGLSTSDNSDTDGDGITDKEEIEVYHTDPLKISSSGDNLPDGYKLFKGLDLNKKYKDTIYIDEIFNVYPNINFKDKNAYNALLYVTEIEYKLDGVSCEKAFIVDNYDGEVTVDFSSYIIDSQDIVYFVVKDGDYEELKSKNNKVTFNTDGKDIVVGIVGKESLSQIFNSTVEIDEDGNYILKGNRALIIISPIMSLFSDEYVWIFEGSFLPKKVTRSDELSDTFSTIWGNTVKVNHHYVNTLEIDIIKKVFDYITNGEYFELALKDTNVSKQEMEDSKSEFRDIMKWFFMYQIYDSGIWDRISVRKEEESLEKSEEDKLIKFEKPDKYISTFDVNKDALPFANLSTYISPGGNCAGFAEITTALFNNNLYKPSETITFGEKSWNYDISGIDECNTFFDKYLDDYKSKKYWKETYGSNRISKVSEYKGDDKKFIDFLGYKWNEFNEVVDSDVRFWNDYDSWDTIEALKEYFASGDKIVSVAMYSGASHAINAYGIEEDPSNPNICYILIYDNNFPNHKFGDATINNKIKVEKKTKSHWGKEDTYYYKYDYYPIPSKAKDYRYTNKLFTDKGSALGNVLQASGIIFIDENYNIIR